MLVSTNKIVIRLIFLFAKAVGFGGGPLWCAKCTYLTVVAEALAIFNGKNSKSDALVVRFFGLFFIFYQLAQVWGNLISSSGKFLF